MVNVSDTLPSEILGVTGRRSDFRPGLYIQELASTANSRSALPREVQRCFLTHTFWNGRIDEIRPLILLGLAGLIFEAF